MKKQKLVRGVLPLSQKLKEHLRKRQHILARLQLLGRIEDYLTKEFASVILEESRFSVLPLINIGAEEDGRRIDIALLQGDFSRALSRKQLKEARNKCKIRAFIELKYVGNRHRYTYASAHDEIRPSFKSLRKQLHRFDTQQPFARYEVKLRGEGTYGLVFASHVRFCHETECEPSQFADWVKGVAREEGLRYHDLQYPQLDSIYEDVRVEALKGHYYVSLYMGLWRPAPAKATVEKVRAKGAAVG